MCYFAGLWCVVCYWLTPSVCAQNIVWNVGTVAGASADGSKQPASFTLPVQAGDVKDSLEEYERFVKHEQWEKAFKTLETIATKTTTGFIDRGDGVLVPSRLLSRGLLASLPAGGRSAYRLFYDAQATALWEKAVGRAEAESLSGIVNGHIISSTGDRAADRLGDLYFEQGDMAQAVGAWRALLTLCPDSKISKAQTSIKIATALARGGRWAEFAELDAQLRDRYASETVEIAGRRTTVQQYMAQLAATDRAAPIAVDAELPADFTLPDTDVGPAWRFTFQSKPDPLNANQPFNITDMYGRQRANDFVIPAAIDDQRLYVNLFGVEMGFDLASGKLLWRNGKLHQLQLQQARQGVAPERYWLGVSGGRVWTVTRDAQQQNQQATFALVARDGATGKEVINTRKSLNSWNIMGAPVFVQSTGASPSSSPAGNTPEPSSAPAAPVINLDKGFDGAKELLTFNGKSGKISNGALRLTENRRDELSAVFVTAPVSVASFTSEFDLQFKNAQADGMTFVVQGAGVNAIGKGGNGLGYGEMPKSVAVKFGLWAEGANRSGLLTNGAAPAGENNVDMGESGIQLNSGHVFRVKAVYDGTTLQVTVTDTTTNASHTQNHAVDIPAIVGGRTAFVGFTGGTGGRGAQQDVLRWTYIPGAQRISQPQAVGGTIFVGAARNGQGREVAVLVLNATDGKLLKTIQVGNHAVDQNQIYTERMALPSIFAHRDRVYVDTHGGALVSLAAQAGTIDWGVQYESPSPQANYYSYDYQTPQLSISGPMYAAGLLFTKGMRSMRLVGIQPEGPNLIWNRPVAKSSVLIGADAARLYMGGEELTAYDLKTQELVWAAQLPRSASWSQPLLTKNRLYQFTSRGVCEIDKSNGEIVKIFRGTDLDSFGGSLFVGGNTLVTVSNLTVTAYPLGTAPTTPKQP